MDETRRVLIVEADTIAAMIIERYFHKLESNVHILHVTTGRQAIHFLQKEKFPVLVVAEPVLPDMSPTAFLQYLHTENLFRKIRLCLLSVLYPYELAAVVEGFPVTRYFSKPVSLSYIEEILTMLGT